MFFGHVNSKNVNSRDFWIFMMLLNTEILIAVSLLATWCRDIHSRDFIAPLVRPFATIVPDGHYVY